jgi:predicted DNA-binding protein with PD1-like motif
MRSQQLNAGGRELLFALIFDTGDEVIKPLEIFAAENRLAGSHFTAIGAFSDAVVAWFDWQSKQYKHIPIKEQVEVLTLAGDIALADGKPKIHAHVVLGKSDGSACGGHLIEAHVRPTLEVILEESPRHLRRKHDPQSGLPLIQL